MLQNLETLQILQVVLFAFPVLTLITMGLIILLKPVAALNRRWMLLVLLPLLLDNLLAVFGNEDLMLADILSDWYFWLILAADLALGIGMGLGSRGYAVYGLAQEQLVDALLQELKADGFTVEAGQGSWKTLWGGESEGIVIAWEKEGGSGTATITSRLGEVLIRTKSRRDLMVLGAFIGEIQTDENPYDFSQHAVGVLYLVMAVVLAVFGWIYFFEPRLVLVE